MLLNRRLDTYRSDDREHFEVTHVSGRSTPSSLYHWCFIENLVAEHRYEQKLVLRYHIVTPAIIINSWSTAILFVHLEPELGDRSGRVDGDDEVVVDERDVLAWCHGRKIRVLNDCAGRQSGSCDACAILSTAVPIAPQHRHSAFRIDRDSDCLGKLTWDVNQMRMK